MSATPRGLETLLPWSLFLLISNLTDKHGLPPVHNLASGAWGSSSSFSTHTIESCSLPGPQFLFLKSGPPRQTYLLEALGS